MVDVRVEVMEEVMVEVMVEEMAEVMVKVMVEEMAELMVELMVEEMAELMVEVMVEVEVLVPESLGWPQPGDAAGQERRDGAGQRGPRLVRQAQPDQVLRVQAVLIHPWGKFWGRHSGPQGCGSRESYRCQ